METIEESHGQKSQRTSRNVKQNQIRLRLRSRPSQTRINIKSVPLISPVSSAFRGMFVEDNDWSSPGFTDKRDARDGSLKASMKSNLTAISESEKAISHREFSS
jgi:hypothetical protein